MTVIADEIVVEGKTHLLMVGVKTCTANMEISLVVPWEASSRSTSRSNYSPLGYIHKGLYILLQATFLKMFFAALFIITRNCSLPSCLSTDEWMAKGSVVHSHNRAVLSPYKYEIKKFTAEWINVEKIILSQVT